MWVVYGIITIAIQPGVLQIIDRKEFKNPQDCFEEAMVIMQDKEDPRGMACVPVPDDRKAGV
tara:strand:- start:130 stop:315 length:186 start_codon:yes stop_codon:yes gene_type:complete